MTAEKSELKLAWIETQGLQAEERVEALRADYHRADGAVKAMEESARKIEQDVFARFKRDLDEGTLPGDPAQATHKYLMTCLHYLQHLAKNGAANLPVLQGQMQEAQLYVDRLSKEREAERAKLKALKQAQEKEAEPPEAAEVGGKSPRAIGTHPGPNLKAQRTQAKEAEPPKVPAAPIRKRATKKKATKKRGKNT